MAFAALRCAVSGHDLLVRDNVQGTPVWRCPRCWQTQARERVEDPRPLQKPDARFIFNPIENVVLRRSAMTALAPPNAGGSAPRGCARTQLGRLTAAQDGGRRQSVPATRAASGLPLFGRQYRQLFRSAPGGAVFSIRSTDRGMNIWW